MSEFSFFGIILKITFYLPITNTFSPKKVHRFFEKFFKLFLGDLETSIQVM